MSSTWTLKPGVDIVYDGDACTVAEICDGAVIVRTRTGQVRRLRMIDLLRPALREVRHASPKQSQ
jgi:hypothetical protein